MLSKGSGPKLYPHLSLGAKGPEFLDVRVVIVNTKKKDSSSERTIIRLQADDTTTATAAAAADACASFVKIHPF
jgi:hypothetical protein